jgi:probable F420-dependent oxidoreductase
VSKRRLRFGFTGGGVPGSTNEWRDFLRKAEDRGYSTMVVGDHMGGSMAAMPTMLAAALHTTRLRVGSHVLANDFRNPVMLAKESATIDLFSGGRLELGVGAGYDFRGTPGNRMASDWEQTGIRFDSAGSRVSRLAEALTIIKTFFERDEPFAFHGDYYRVQGIVPAPRAVQRPRPPIMVGGIGRRMLELAAREADIVAFAARPPNGINPISGAAGLGLTFAQQVDLVRKAAADRYADLELSVFAMSPQFTDDVDGSVERLAVQMRTTTDVIRDSPWALMGSVEAIIERIEAERERYDLSYWIIGAASIDTFAPVVARLAGT